MKRLTFLHTGLLAVLASIPSLPSHADTIVSVNLGPDAQDGSGTVVSTNPAGVIAAENWNNIYAGPAFAQALTDQTGSTNYGLNMTLTMGAHSNDGQHLSGGFTDPNAAGNNELMYGEVYTPSPTNLDLNFTSTTAFHGDVYVYYRAGDVTNLQTFSLFNTLTSASLATSQDGYEDYTHDPNSRFVQSNGLSDLNNRNPALNANNANYVEFTKVTLSKDFTLQGTPVYNPTLGYGYAYIDGVEFVSSPLNTPEPSTYAMLGLGLAMLAVLQRRRQVSVK
jgi:hypothetical protein